jgi:hypothetical protein
VSPSPEASSSLKCRSLLPIFVTSPQPGCQENIFLLGFRMSMWRHFYRSCEKTKWSGKCQLQLSSWCKLVFGALTVQGEKFGSRDHFPSAASNAPLSDLLHSTICPRNPIGPQLSKKFLHPNASLALSEVSRLPRDLITRPETSIGHAQYHLVFPKLCCTSQSSCRLEGPG